MNVSKGKKPR